MKSIEIKGKLRESLGKGNSGKLRAQGNVPCVLYGEGENVHFFAHENDFRHILYTPNVYRVNLDIEGKNYEAVLQDVQFHPVTDRVLHIDFYQIREDKPVIVNVHTKLNGVSPGVKEGGKLLSEIRWLRIRGLPKDIPDVLDIDVSGLTLGETIKAGELDYPGIEIMHSSNSVVASVKLTRISKAAAAILEADEAEEEESEESEGTKEESSEDTGESESGGEEEK